MQEEVEEIWKDVVGYEGLYRVSSFGRVFGVKANKILKSHITQGYCRIALCKNGVSKNKRVNVLEAQSFIDSDYLSKGLVCNHIDFNKQNNNLSNLELITARENTNKLHIPSSSNFLGVSKHGNNWRSLIVVNGKQIRLGTFKTELEASEYYNDALNCIKEGRIADIVINKVIPMGYSFHKRDKVWQARITIGGKIKHLGTYNKEEDAKKAYSDALAAIEEGRIEDACKNVRKPKGCTYSKSINKWVAQARFNGQNRCLGYFEKEEDARLAYENAIKCIKEKRYDDVFIKRKEKKGYYFDKSRGKWSVQVAYNGKRISLGRFNSEEDAIKALSAFKG
jgi:hypothetical protein